MLLIIRIMIFCFISPVRQETGQIYMFTFRADKYFMALEQYQELKTISCENKKRVAPATLNSMFIRFHKFRVSLEMLNGLNQLTTPRIFDGKMRFSLCVCVGGKAFRAIHEAFINLLVYKRLFVKQ
jgi:hypothetical protein